MCQNKSKNLGVPGHKSLIRPCLQHLKKRQKQLDGQHNAGYKDDPTLSVGTAANEIEPHRVMRNTVTLESASNNDVPVGYRVDNEQPENNPDSAFEETSVDSVQAAGPFGEHYRKTLANVLHPNLKDFFR